MLRQMKAGTTSGTLPLFLQDSSSSTGAGLTGLVYNSSGLTCYYKRSDGTAAVAVTLADITTLGTYVDSGFKAIDGTNAPGLYEFHPPDAALAAGARWVVFYFKGATNLAQTPVLVELTATDNQSATSFGSVTLADGVTHGGTTAKLRLGGTDATPPLYVTSSGTDAVKYLSTFASGNGLTTEGGSSGAGWYSEGAYGIFAEGSIAGEYWTNSLAASTVSFADGTAAITAGTNGLSAVKFTAVGGAGLDISGSGSNGRGLLIAGRFGNLIYANGAGVDANGLTITGAGTGAGVEAAGGSSGAGFLGTPGGSEYGFHGTLSDTGAIADRLLGRNLAGSADGGRTVKDALRSARNKVAFDVPAAGQFTVYAEDDATPAWTGTYARGASTLGPLTSTDPG